jgi:hypothetical protein
MRLIAGLLTLLIAAAPASAVAGECPDCPPPALADDEALPSVEQAVAATRALLRAVRSKKNEAIVAAIALPFGFELGTVDDRDGNCVGNARLEVEAEGLPGIPQCLAAGLARHAKKLERALSKKSVHAGVAALEKRRGKLRGDARAWIAGLQHHRLVHLKASGLRVVIAVRLDGGEPRVDAVIVDR